MQTSNSGRQDIQVWKYHFTPSNLPLFTNIIIKSYQKVANYGGHKTKRPKLTDTKPYLARILGHSRSEGADFAGRPLARAQGDDATH